MNDFYDHVQYVVPENSEIFFSFSPETKYVFLKLVDGVADVYVKDKQIELPLQEEFSIKLWECLCPRLETKTGCNFLVRGNHYVSSAIQHRPVENTLFGISPIESTYSFALEKHIQLQIFPVKFTEQELPVTISVSRGSPETSGFKLSRETTYQLSPFSPVLLKSSDEKPYSVYVKGLNRKAMISIRDEKHHKCVKDVKDRIFAKRLLSKQFKHISQTILVLGPKNAGKTSFCHLLVNEILEKRMTPVYVDLNVKRNVSVPGLLSLSEIETRIDSTLDFNYNMTRLLHYGSAGIFPYSVQFYYFLLQKMGGLLSFHLNYNSKENSLAIIDSDEFHGENNATIEILLKSFAVDLVVYIGDEHYYQSLKNSMLKNVPSEFIPKFPNAVQMSNSFEERFYQHRIRKYFSCSTNPFTQNARTIALRLLTVYRIALSQHVTNARNTKPSDYRIERVDFNIGTNRNMLKRLFGVSAARRAELRAVCEIKYYVYFVDIDMGSKIATVIVPESENFNGGILVMGHVLRLEDSEIV